MKLLLHCIVLAALAQHTLAEPCTADDYYGEYTTCRAEQPHPLRDALFRWRKGATCDPNDVNSVSLPPNKFDLRCDLSCAEGHYLPVGETTCQPCKAGTVSVGGGKLVSHWKEWPTDVAFSTRCERNLNRMYAPGRVSDCEGWILDNWRVHSGNVSSQESSVLELKVNLVQAGKVSFHYFVSAEERFDGLIFQVDNADQIIESDKVLEQVALPLVSNTPSLANFSAPLSAGSHVLTWKFFKDFYTDSGDDRAYIKNVLITGLSYADDQCHQCPLGTRAPEEQMVECELCPRNTFSAAPGSADCAACDADSEFSFVGAHVCLPRVPCTNVDYETVHGPCEASATGDMDNSRRVEYKWLEPRICDSRVQGLPATTRVACADCLPGTVRNPGPACSACPVGAASKDGSSCSTCPAGTAAVPVRHLGGEFDAWPVGMTTLCTGDCATSGWRLTGRNADSGIGHGANAEVILKWDVEVPSLHPQPYVEFNFTLSCEGDISEECDLGFSVVGNFSQSWSFNTEYQVVRVEFIRTGTHQLEWTFSKASTDAVEAESRAILHSIGVYGASGGGAVECVECAPGTVSQAGAASCIACPPGKGANAAKDQCVDCPMGQFSDGDGFPCMACPHGTKPLADLGATGCDDGGCRYSPDNGQTQYDLSALKSTSFYGPIVVDEHDYELNVCSTDHHTSTNCLNPDGSPVVAYACQVLENGIGLSLGSRIGYHTLESENDTLGVIVEYSGGKFGCKNLHVDPLMAANAPGIHRKTNITFICDPTAGRGSPEPCPNKKSLFDFFSFFSYDGVEPKPCHYCFEWRSIYGCPVCTEADRVQVFGECQGGVRRRLWKWIDGKKCHGGELPAPDTIPCGMEVDVDCKPGEYLPPGTKECKKCAPGQYSLGTGKDYWNLEESADLFDKPTNGDNAFVADGPTLHSGEGNSSISLSLRYNEGGFLRFYFHIVGQGGEFTVTTSGANVEEKTLYYRGSDKLNVASVSAMGETRITFRFTNGTSKGDTGDLRKVIVYQMTAAKIARALLSCASCPAGTVSDSEGAGQCTPCEAGTVASRDGIPVLSGGTTCMPCENGYSYPGSGECFEFEPMCELERHFTMKRTKCEAGQQIQYPAWLEPRRCADDRNFQAMSNMTVQCVTAVQRCNTGEYFEAGVCKPAPANSVLVRTSSFLDTGGAGRQLIGVAGVSTSCQALGHGGVCAGGWRARGASIDSGAHGHDWVISTLTIAPTEETFAGPGVLNLTVQFLDDGTSGQASTETRSTAARAALFVHSTDMPQYAIDKSGTYSIEISGEPLKLVYYQEELHGGETDRFRGVEVSNVLFESSGGGFATSYRYCEPGQTAKDYKCVKCPAGQQSVDGKSPCTECPVDEYSAVAGSLCQKCGAASSTDGKTGQTSCVASCAFDLPASSNSTLSFNITRVSQFFTVHNRDVLAISLCKRELTCSEDGTPSYVNWMRKDPERSCASTGAERFVSLSESGKLNIDFVGQALSEECEQHHTRVQMDCHFDDSFDPVVIDPVVPDPCSTFLLWKTSFGCRKCQPSDYSRTDDYTPCKDGKHTVFYRPTTLCNGEQEKSEETECVLEFAFPWWYFAAGAGVVVLLLCCACFCAARNRRLAHRYKQLEGHTMNQTPMQLIEDDSSDDNQL